MNLASRLILASTMAMGLSGCVIVAGDHDLAVQLPLARGRVTTLGASRLELRQRTRCQFAPGMFPVKRSSMSSSTVDVSSVTIR